MRITNERLTAAEDHIAANIHEFGRVAVVSSRQPILQGDDGSEVFELGEDQTFTLPSGETIRGPGLIDTYAMRGGWHRVYFIQGVNEAGDDVAYTLTAT